MQRLYVQTKGTYSKEYPDAVPGSRAEGRGERRAKQMWYCPATGGLYRTRRDAARHAAARRFEAEVVIALHLKNIATVPVYHAPGEED